jgi:hypothetical protein
MAPLNPTGRLWLKGFHIFATALWVGSGICLMAMNLIARPENGYELHGVLLTLKLIDDVVLIPSAIGSFLTGLLLSWLTPWGFFKWRWVTLKWVLTIALMVFGTFWMGPWLNEMEMIAASRPDDAFADPALLGDRLRLLITAVPMLLALLVMVFISVIKPWRRHRQGGAR